MTRALWIPVLATALVVVAVLTYALGGWDALRFVLVWLAAAALCWWPLARWWTPTPVALREIRQGELVELDVDFELRGGSRAWSPLVATAAAWAAELLVWVLP